MKIYILMFDDRVERASCDVDKINRLADESNGYDHDGSVLCGPYFVVEQELEDFDITIRDRFNEIINGKGLVIPRIAVKVAVDDLLN